MGDYAKAREIFREVLTLARGLDTHQPVSWALWGMAGSLLGLGKAEQATRVLAATERLLEVLHTQLPLMWRKLHGDDVSAAREALGTEAFDAAWAEGRAMTLDQAITHALE